MTTRNDWGEDPLRAALPTPAITVLRRTRSAGGGREIFNVATIERAAERLAGAIGERPLLGRLRYLRVMNFPSPVAKGRGNKAALGLDDLMQTLFALELMHAGMVPTRAMRVIRTDWTTIKGAIAYGWSRANGIGDLERPFRMLVLAPSVLSELGSDDRATDPLHETIGIMARDELSGLLASGSAPRRMVLIDTEQFVTALSHLDESVLGVTREVFANEMRMFCAEAFGTADATGWDVGGFVRKTLQAE